MSLHERLAEAVAAWRWWANAYRRTGTFHARTTRDLMRTDVRELMDAL